MIKQVIHHKGDKKHARVYLFMDMLIMNELDYIRFDVGNYLFVCHRSTINRFPESKLADLIRPEKDTRKSAQDYIVIDRDGKHFGTILNYMRDPTSLDLSTWNSDDLEDLETEANFYDINGLIGSCQVAKYYKDQPATDGSLMLTKYDLVFDREILNHLSSYTKLTYLFSFELSESFNQLIEDIDPTSIDVCCFIGKFPGCEDAKSLIYDPIDREVICATSSENQQSEMVYICQRISKLGVGYYDRIPALFEMLNKDGLEIKDQSSERPNSPVEDLFFNNYEDL